MLVERLEARLALSASGPPSFAGPGLEPSDWQPFLDNGNSPGVGSFKVDLTPAAKAWLKGTGTVQVIVAPAQSVINSAWTTEIVGGSTVSIPYANGVTTPATVQFRRAGWMPNNANEFESQISWVSASTAADSVIGGHTIVVQAMSRGSYLATVRDYMTRNQDLAFWIPLHFDLLQGRNVTELVQYMVPEEAFKEWAVVANNPNAISLGFALGYTPDRFAAWQTDQVLGGRGVYTLEAFGWKSVAEFDELVEDYVARVRPVNDSFSFSSRNRVPVDYFLQKLVGLPQNWDAARKDYEIATLYHEEQAAIRLGQLGLPAAELMARFATDYSLRQYTPVAPHAIEAMARTFSDPNYRTDAPLAFVAVNRDFARGTFSEADIIGTLAQTHRIVVAEAKNATEFLQAARLAEARHGKIGIAVCVGHGSGTDASCFGIEDRAAFQELGGLLAPGATVMLASCSGAAYYPDRLADRLAGGGSRAVHVAAAMQAAMPAARVVAATDLVQKSMVTFDAAATTPEGRYRIAYTGSGVWGDVFGTAANGTPRDWLRRQFGPGQNWAALETADSDGDGQANWLEYRAGTNLRSAQDVLTVRILNQPGSGPASLEWPGTFRNEYGEPFRVVFTPTGGAPQVVADRIERAVRGVNQWTDTVQRGAGSYSIEGFPGSAAPWNATLPPRGLSISTVAALEGSGAFVFTVTLSRAATSPVTVRFATANGTAVAGPARDYMATRGMLTFAPGQTSRTITVTVRDDTLVEADETFFVNLSQASGATIAAGRATGTIRNDDQPPPGLSIASVRAVEGSGLFVFTVTLSSLSTQPVTVRYATANGTAVAGSRGDYTATSGTLRFNPGETVKTIAVAVRNDSLVERDETFFVNLSQPTAASIQTGRATGTILDDDRVSVANWAAFAGLASSPGAAGGKQRPFAAG